MVFTDPPYGDDHASSVIDHSRAKAGKSIVTKINKIASDKNLDFLPACIESINPWIKEKATKLLFFKWSKWVEVLSATNSWGEPSAVCVWDREQIGAATFRFNPVHEFCFHWGNLSDKRSVSHLTNVWRAKREDGAKELHPTVKPQEILAPAVAVCSSGGESILDPFLGAGSIMVACQNLNRKCRGIEISPDYCAVILQRMLDAFPGIEINKIK